MTSIKSQAQEEEKPTESISEKQQRKYKYHASQNKNHRFPPLHLKASRFPFLPNLLTVPFRFLDRFLKTQSRLDGVQLVDQRFLKRENNSQKQPYISFIKQQQASGRNITQVLCLKYDFTRISLSIVIIAIGFSRVFRILKRWNKKTEIQIYPRKVLSIQKSSHSWRLELGHY